MMTKDILIEEFKGCDDTKEFCEKVFDFTTQIGSIEQKLSVGERHLREDREAMMVVYKDLSNIIFSIREHDTKENLEKCIDEFLLLVYNLSMKYPDLFDLMNEIC